MTVRPIRLYPDPVLRSPTAPVTAFDDALRALVRDLVETTSLEGRAGVASTQIGVSLAAFSYHIDGEIGYIVNPVLEETGGDLVEIQEGCLSVPGIWAPTPRYEYARVRGVDASGDELVLEGTGLMAQMLQHETDHLNGIVYLDRLTREQRRTTLRQVRESDWF
ncbi:peptide deformylase [Pseudoclavibacter chungangensis]|uniref:Peptide deformylase n=1 Tax=Pseudoclavibacter chungangensis TaxID=587635 RepID=A0A7J5BZL4_9MICO|nr:peptide deformylase [Pseudoclavibacter chungangensis]KAB1660092.1 peptide deformylase [Pseudoclavibacter chungangensis]NYJ66805.1 peptide deformylase [Pseudoclavibacter chungangensis]